MEVNVTVELTDLKNIDTTQSAIKFGDMTVKGLRKVAISGNLTIKGTDKVLYKPKEEDKEGKPSALGVSIICDSGYKVCTFF